MSEASLVIHENDEPFPVSISLISVIHIAPNPCALFLLALVPGSSFYRVLEADV